MILLAPNRRRQTNPAQCTAYGTISNGADWVETLTIVDQNGDQVTGVGSDTFTIQFRDDPDDTSADLSFTSPGDMTVTVGGSTTTLAISVDAADIGALAAGDYVFDIVSETSGGVSTHRAHGLVKILGAPIAV